MSKNECRSTECKLYCADDAYGKYMLCIAQIIEDCTSFIRSHHYGPWYADSVSKVELESLLMDRNMNGDSFRGGESAMTLSEASCMSIALLRGAWELPTEEVLANLTDAARQLRQDVNKYWILFDDTRAA